MIKKTILFLAVLSISFNTIYSQDDQSINVNMNDLLIARLLVTYTHKIIPDNYLELTLGYRYYGSHQETGGEDAWFGNTVMDELGICYNQITARAGLRRYFFNRVYVSFLGNYNYRYNHDFRIDGESGNPDIHWKYYKTMNQIGYIIKAGLVVDRSSNTEFYFGFGEALSYNTKTLLSTNASWEKDFSTHSFKRTNVSFVIGITTGIKL